MSNIKEFRIGDVITRVEKSTRGDGSFRTEAIEFLGLNGEVIYARLLEGYLKNKTRKFIMSEWGEGWQIVGTPKNPKESRRIRNVIRKKRSKNKGYKR